MQFDCVPYIDGATVNLISRHFSLAGTYSILHSESNFMLNCILLMCKTSDPIEVSIIINWYLIARPLRCTRKEKKTKLAREASEIPPLLCCNWLYFQLLRTSSAFRLLTQTLSSGIFLDTYCISVFWIVDLDKLVYRLIAKSPSWKMCSGISQWRLCGAKMIFVISYTNIQFFIKGRVMTNTICGLPTKEGFDDLESCMLSSELDWNVSHLIFST